MRMIIGIIGLIISVAGLGFATSCATHLASLIHMRRRGSSSSGDDEDYLEDNRDGEIDAQENENNDNDFKMHYKAVLLALLLSVLLIIVGIGLAAAGYAGGDANVVEDVVMTDTR